MKTEQMRRLPDGSIEKIIKIEGAPKEQIMVCLIRNSSEHKEICSFFGKGTLTMNWRSELFERGKKDGNDSKK